MAQTKSTAKTTSKSKKTASKSTIKATTTKKLTGKGKRKTVSSSKPKTDQSFISFLGLVIIASFLIGGLVGSFNFYRTLVGSEQTDTVVLPSTGLVSEADIDEPLPATIEPGPANIDETADDEEVAETEQRDPRQPDGTVEFNDGDYKVYQYPDGNIIVVW